MTNKNREEERKIKTAAEYHISMVATESEFGEFEKYLNDKLITNEEMIEWNDSNDEENPPSGVTMWTKYKFLKASLIRVWRKKWK